MIIAGHLWKFLFTPKSACGQNQLLQVVPVVIYYQQSVINNQELALA